VAHVKETASALAKNNQYAIMATPWLLFPFERAHALQGMDKFLMNMSIYPDFAQALLRKALDLCKVNMEHFLTAIGDNIDIIKIGDDLGMQERLLISPRMYRQFLKPLHAEFISFIKERTKAKVFFHTDGDVFDLIPDFIEIGVDILNPIQTSAGHMSDLAGLKSRYGKEIIFCGAIDTQKVLPFGTPDEVRNEVRRVINILGKDGGYMVASVHTIMHEVPPENVLAMVDAIEEYGHYPLK
jgi:uroporphyrinogen decarboxylase